MKATQQQKNCTIAVVGDVHDQWDWQDHICLSVLGADLALFVGDFGNEAIALVKRVAALNLPKAVILGNHDAHYSASKRGRKKCPYDRTIEDRVQQQLDDLGESHVGYSKQDFDFLGLSVVGSRPFSWGGSKWRNKEFYQQRFGVSGFEASTERILSAVATTRYPTTIFLAHNGPKGLGGNPHDICGRDWKPAGGDYGDPDLTSAIEQTRQLGKQIPLVTFGHMHHRLRHTNNYQRTAIVIDEYDTVYFNAALVPRILKTEEQTWRHFFLVSLSPYGVTEICSYWVGEAWAIVKDQIFVAPMGQNANKLLS
ncbi:TIGR04168 family protein [Dactylococcopsis salina]|uniref:Calcineurin-like phosphoesterase n=1 Tax=Dactylococcopsis salina (strain PCC 8305) TaxID=13035 RepID=K9YRA4_DACS8|nr:TIGR04168 family protein [Dactylococcopsis salina]AFZ49439.1 Calcineurin-like phosphoesterase [Dactylococcopsis salina PCC 8305]